MGIDKKTMDKLSKRIYDNDNMSEIDKNGLKEDLARALYSGSKILIEIGKKTYTFSPTWDEQKSMYFTSAEHIIETIHLFKNNKKKNLDIMKT